MLLQASKEVSFASSQLKGYIGLGFDNFSFIHMDSVDFRLFSEDHRNQQFNGSDRNQELLEDRKGQKAIAQPAERAFPIVKAFSLTAETAMEEI